jgi:hypothetical protein
MKSVSTIGFILMFFPILSGIFLINGLKNEFGRIERPKPMDWPIRFFMACKEIAFLIIAWHI